MNPWDIETKLHCEPVNIFGSWARKRFNYSLTVRKGSNEKSFALIQFRNLINGFKIYCYVISFLNTFKYEFVNCKQIKNEYVFSFSFSLLYTLFICPTFTNLYNNNYKNNWLFDIFLTQLFAIVLITEIFKPRLFCSHKGDWILTDSRLLYLPFYSPIQSI